MNYNMKKNMYINKKLIQGKYSLFSTDISDKYLNTDAEEIYFDVIKEWDEKCNLPVELGETLNRMSNDKNNIIAFSRVFISKLNCPGIIISNEIYDIANHGLKNNGHINSSGAVQRINQPSNVLTPLINIEGWINLIGSYKGNNATILYSIPKKYITDDCYLKKDEYANSIYNFAENCTYIKPEFLIGMIIKNKDYPDIFLTREDMLQMNTKIK